MAVRRLSAVIIAALVGSILLAAPAQAAPTFVTIGAYEYRYDPANVADGASLLGPTGAVGPALVVPSSVDIAGTTYAVTQVDGHAFESTGLTSVVIPSSVRYLQPYSFASNNLTSVSIPSNVTLINTGAFYNNALTSITLAQGLDTIGAGAFNRNALTSVVVPASVTRIDANAFAVNPNLASITFVGNAPLLTGTAALGAATTLVKFYADATGFTTPTWKGGGTTTYSPQVIPNAVVTFDANGHGTAPSAASGRPGFAAANPGDLSASGVTFDGWFTSASGGTQAGFPYTASASVTLYAHWSPVVYNVTVDAQNGTAPESLPTVIGSSVDLDDAVYTGHAFTGWFTAASGGTQITFPYTVTGDVTLYAQWSVNQHTVTFDPANGASATNQAADYGTTISAPMQPSRASHSFDGWFTAATGGAQVTFPYTVTGDITLYAQWTSTDITLTIDRQDGSEPQLLTLSGPFYVGIGYGDYPGHTFAGWWTAPTGGTSVPSSFVVYSNTTVYAQWTVNNYTVTFEPGNGDAASTASSDYGTTVPAPADPSRAHYGFTGWFTEETGGTEVAFPYTVAGDATLYAQWSIDTHTVTFEPTNGDASTSATADYNGVVMAPTEPTRLGYEFAGWFTAASSGAQVAFPYTVTSDATVYAQWKHLDPSFTAPGQAAPGETIAVTGQNFVPGESVEIWLRSTPVKLATIVVGSDGTFATTVVIPSSTLAGNHHIELRGSASGTLSNALTVSDALATTGAEIARSGLLAALLMLGGFSLILLRRRSA